MYDDIVVPTDGSEASMSAVEHAVQIAEDHGATIHAVYVIDTRNMLGDMDWSPVRDEMMREGEAATQEVLEKAENLDDQERNRNIVTMEEVRDGVPSKQIIEYSREVDADLIVMGTHGRTDLERTVLGSVTEKVLRQSDIPVLAAPES